MLLQSCNYLISGQWNQRIRHSSIVVKDSLYCWGGDQKDLPTLLINNCKDKRKSTSSVDIFHFFTFEWKRTSSTGNPLMGYTYTNIENNVLYFGGSCQPLDCYHNNLHLLQIICKRLSVFLLITNQ